MLLNLRLNMGSEADESDDDTGEYCVALYKSLSSRAAVENVLIDWSPAVFAKYRTLQRLDLTSMPLQSVHMGELLDAASLHCPDLQVLILPKREEGYLLQKKLKRTFAKLYVALKR